MIQGKAKDVVDKAMALQHAALRFARTPSPIEGAWAAGYQGLLDAALDFAGAVNGKQATKQTTKEKTR